MSGKISEGIYGFYKPKGISSFGVVKWVKRHAVSKRVGHAGTLDPLASGVLVIAVGRPWTRKLAEVVAKEKEYLAKIKLGVNSSTDDEEGEKIAITMKLRPKKEQVEKVLKKFVGKIRQTPPIFSALKIKGQRAYDLARKGLTVRIKSRIVEVKKIELLRYQWPFVHLRVISGPGVYIRALARDIGKHLKTGGYLRDLERARVGEFTKKMSKKIPGLKESEWRVSGG